MKKFFSSGGGNDHQSSFVGKSFVVGRCQCVVEEVIAEGKLVVFQSLPCHLSDSLCIPLRSRWPVWR